VQYKAQVDAAGNPVKDANGRFVKGDIVGITVMEKRAGWGTEYPDDIRNGEWEYSAFGPDQKFKRQGELQGLLPVPQASRETGLRDLAGAARGKAPGGPVAMKTSPNDVGIAGFAFGPGKLSIGAGQNVRGPTASTSAQPRASARKRLLRAGT